MRVIIAGSRDITDYDLVVQAIKDSGFEITEVISGNARGVDRLGERYAKENNIPLTVMPADWDRYGKRAGYRRNEEMAEIGEAVVAIILNNSRGSEHMVNISNDKGLRVFTHRITS